MSTSFLTSGLAFASLYLTVQRASVSFCDALADASDQEGRKVEARSAGRAHSLRRVQRQPMKVLQSQCLEFQNRVQRRAAVPQSSQGLDGTVRNPPSHPDSPADPLRQRPLQGVFNVQLAQKLGCFDIQTSNSANPWESCLQAKRGGSRRPAERSASMRQRTSANRTGRVR